MTLEQIIEKNITNGRFFGIETEVTKKRAERYSVQKAHNTNGAIRLQL